MGHLGLLWDTFTLLFKYNDYRGVDPEDLDCTVKRDIQRYEIEQVPGSIIDFRTYEMNLLEFGVLTKRKPGQ